MSPSRSSMSGKAGAWAPNCWPGCRIGPARRASSRFTALVAAENVAVAGLLRNACASLVGRESDTLEYEISLVPAETSAGRRVPWLAR